MIFRVSEINGLKCFCKCLAAILFSISLENIHRSLHSISATFHIRRKIKGWAREGKFRASFERLKEEGSSKFSSKIRPLGKLNIPAIPFDPCLDGDGLENPQIYSSPQISHRIGRRETLLLPNPSPSLLAKISSSWFPFSLESKQVSLSSASEEEADWPG